MKTAILFALALVMFVSAASAQTIYSTFAVYQDPTCSIPMIEQGDIPVPSSPSCVSVETGSVIFQCTPDGSKANFSLNVWQAPGCKGVADATIAADNPQNACGPATFSLQGQSLKVYSIITCKFSSFSDQSSSEFSPASLFAPEVKQFAQRHQRSVDGLRNLLPSRQN